MCKVMLMAGITSETRELAWAFIREMAKEISPGNTDGLGYAAVTTTGDLFGERWHLNAEAFVNRDSAEPLSPLDNHLIKYYYGAIKKASKPIRYNKFGVIAEDSIAAITLHTRMATSGKEFANTHPFVLGKTSLIHNGVISNAERLEMKQSTCDSETILNLYAKKNVSEKPKNIQLVANKLRGYYACGVLSENTSQGVFMDVFKCSRAILDAAFIKELNTMVFSSRISDIKAVCGRMGLTVLSEFVFEDDTFIRIDALTGEPIEQVSFQSVGYSSETIPTKRKSRGSSQGLTLTESQWSGDEISVTSDWSYTGDSWYKKKR